MSISLTKGGNVSLSKEELGLSKILIGLGWDERATDGTKFDLDASAFMLASSGKVRDDSGFIFYNNLVSSDGSIVHTGDNLTGEGDGDDEEIKVNLDAVPADVQKIAIAASIHDHDIRNQNFGMMSNAYIRIVNDATNREIARYDLAEDYSVETALIIGEVYRHNGEWKFRAVGQGFKGGLAPLATHFGVSVS